MDRLSVISRALSGYCNSQVVVSLLVTMGFNLPVVVYIVTGVIVYIAMLYFALDIFINLKIVGPLEGIKLALRRAVARSKLR